MRSMPGMYPLGGVMGASSYLTHFYDMQIVLFIEIYPGIDVGLSENMVYSQL